MMDHKPYANPKLKLGQQNNDEGSINLAGANKKASLFLFLF